jgi:hypothetical protein
VHAKKSQAPTLKASKGEVAEDVAWAVKLDVRRVVKKEAVADILVKVSVPEQEKGAKIL